MRLVYANLDFEYAWSAVRSGFSFEPTKPIKQLCQKWSAILRLLEPEERAVILRAPQSSVALQWDAVEHIQMWGIPPLSQSPIPSEQWDIWKSRFPDPDSVARVNGKDFSHHVEKKLGVALPYSLLLSSWKELQEQLDACPWDWVVKHPWGVSGRERIQGRKGHFELRHSKWCEKQFKRGSTLLFEPWLEQRHEWSMHFDIRPDGSVQWIGACQLMADGSGTYRGNGCAMSFSVDPQVVDLAKQAVQNVADVGYWGPVGIDAMRGQLAEEMIVRPIMEINARMTFGRLTLALERFVPAGWSWGWYHPTPKESKAIWEQQKLVPVTSKATEPGLYRLPECADPGGASGSFVWISPTDELPDTPY